MNITFSFDNTIFEVEADAPTAHYDTVTMQRPRKLKKVKGKLLPRFVRQELEQFWGRYHLHPVTFKFSSELMPDLYKIVHERMNLQQELVSNNFSILKIGVSPTASSYKFDMKMFNEKNEWNLIGCFLSSIDFPTTDHITVELCVDRIPNLKIIRQEGGKEIIDVHDMTWVD